MKSDSGVNYYKPFFLCHRDNFVEHLSPTEVAQKSVTKIIPQT
jgi:hypothetical protein